MYIVKDRQLAANPKTDHTDLRYSQCQPLSILRPFKPLALCYLSYSLHQRNIMLSVFYVCFSLLYILQFDSVHFGYLRPSLWFHFTVCSG